MTVTAWELFWFEPEEFRAECGWCMTMQGTQSKRLRTIIEMASGALDRRIHEFWWHDRLRRAYPEFLFALYGIVSASTPLLERAAHIAGQMRGERLADKLATYLAQHADEERGHDAWLLSDLERLGIDRLQVQQRLPYTSVAALVGTQYFLIEHVHPVAVLGYLAVLENPASPGFVRAASARVGLPLDSMSTILRHAEVDEHHAAEFDRMLDTLPLTDSQRDAMTTSAVMSVSALDRFFVEVLDRFARSSESVDDPGCFRWKEAAPRKLAEEQAVV